MIFFQNRKPSGNEFSFQKIIILSSIIFLAVAFLQCSSVDYVYLKPGYDKNEKKSLKRIVLTMDPASFTNKHVGNLLLTVVHDFLSVQKDYIIYPILKKGKPKTSWIEYCRVNKKIDGVLQHTIRLLGYDGSSTEVGIEATLYDCKTKKTVWKSNAQNDYTSNDPGLENVVSSYANRTNKQYQYLAGPAYLLIRELFDSIPEPVLTEKEKDEKIDIME